MHPSNEYALAHEHQFDKTEMWYVLDCEPGATLYYGFQHQISREEFQQRIQDNTLTEVLNAVPVEKGDLFFIPAGTLHAIRKGESLFIPAGAGQCRLEGNGLKCLVTRV